VDELDDDEEDPLDELEELDDELELDDDELELEALEEDEEDELEEAELEELLELELELPELEDEPVGVGVPGVSSPQPTRKAPAAVDAAPDNSRRNWRRSGASSLTGTGFFSGTV
jgi:hypothetical protein